MREPMQDSSGSLAGRLCLVARPVRPVRKLVRRMSEIASVSGNYHLPNLI